MLEQKFSHVPNFTGYMGVVFRLVPAERGPLKVLDIPAGNGLLAAQLRACGHHVICADINRAGDGYVHADMNERLPFEDAEFDISLCLEGIEHVVTPPDLIRELCRVTRPGGRIILSLPNIQNVFSRFQFLCTGCFYQFTPWMSRHLRPGEQIDRGHISPLSYLQLRYLFQNNGARLIGLRGDRWKKKWLIPFLVPFITFGRAWAASQVRRQKEAPRDECQAMFRHLFSPAALFSRSLILVFERQPNAAGV